MQFVGSIKGLLSTSQIQISQITGLKIHSNGCTKLYQGPKSLNSFKEYDQLLFIYKLDFINV